MSFHFYFLHFLPMPQKKQTSWHKFDIFFSFPYQSYNFIDCSFLVIWSVVVFPGLLSLSVKGAEVASMTMDVIQSIPNLDWLSVWIKAYAFIHAGDNQRAINTIWYLYCFFFHAILFYCVFLGASYYILLKESFPKIQFSALWRRNLFCGITWTSWSAWQTCISGRGTRKMPF